MAETRRDVRLKCAHENLNPYRYWTCWKTILSSALVTAVTLLFDAMSDHLTLMYVFD